MNTEPNTIFPQKTPKSKVPYVFMDNLITISNQSFNRVCIY